MGNVVRAEGVGHGNPAEQVPSLHGQETGSSR